MSVQNEITRIQNARNTLRQKAVALGVGLTTDNLTQLATKYNDISDRGTPNAEVKEGESYTIEPGYYHGGVVQGVAGGGSYNLQAKTVTPTKSEQSVVSDAGYYGLSGVTVNPIPDMFQDVSDVTATAGDVLANKIIVTSDGSVVAGTVPNQSGWSYKFNVEDILDSHFYYVPEGYHNGRGRVSGPSFGELTPVDSDKTAVGDAQMLSGYQGWVNGSKVVGTMPNNGAVSAVLDPQETVRMIYSVPEGYHDGEGTVSVRIGPASGTVAARNAHLLTGESAYVNGQYIVGTMPNNGAATLTMTGLGTVAGDTVVKIPAGYHDGNGTMSLTSDIENALAAI